MNPSPESPNKSFEDKQLMKKVESDHAIALRSAKLGKKLVNKTIKLIDSGDTEKRFFSPSLSSEKADHYSTTLALNSELKSQDIDAEASVSIQYTGRPSDPSQHNLLTLKEVNGKPVTPPSPDNTLDRG